MDSLPKERKILLDEDINEQEFVNMISCFYKQECFIYAIIPNWEEELKMLNYHVHSQGQQGIWVM
ncbi:hypothetical protein J2W44_005661 [Priestia aryabhattai]|uniref:hypothetical protein n=1 Tax=Priestia aryabhattai TaxID=412384 RepID=UPI0027E5041A|nr:hypothetical protein [Priestia aryabhattai]MDP9726549.1 hypothetical protein [Priestia aryabhattai]